MLTIITRLFEARRGHCRHTDRVCNHCHHYVTVCQHYITLHYNQQACLMMCAQVAPSGECLRGKGLSDQMLAKPWRRLFLAAYTL